MYRYGNFMELQVILEIDYELSNKYENILVPVFEIEMSAILKEIEYLENLVT